ncbi:MAG: hypothetical protein A2007_03415 [Verrucomicrobia bacterium GWC2_42_7]|nr:MAG: hypothetical protein A2007_03415 [Verrucomicrobia bacterium GWC2_42_7]
MGSKNRPIVYLIVVVLKLYQWCVSPLYILIVGTPVVCRYNPSCSEYAKQAFMLHGFWRGVLMTLRRLSRCHPFSKASREDPVPVKK